MHASGTDDGGGGGGYCKLLYVLISKQEYKFIEISIVLTLDVYLILIWTLPLKPTPCIDYRIINIPGRGDKGVP